MHGVVESRAFPAWVAFCTALSVAVASTIAIGDSVPARVAAGFIGLAIGLALAFALPAALVARRRRRAVAPVHEEPAEPSTDAPDPRPRLEAQLADGRRLDGSGDVSAWIASTRRLLDDALPGASGYFAALGSRSFPDEQARLDAHVARLETIVRDFL